MSLRTAVARRIEELERSKTAQEYTESVKKLRTLLEASLPHLAPVPLSWESDAHDPDVRNAVDRVLGRVWQVEELEGITVLRVFNSRRELLFKEQSSDRADINARIEKARSAMYARELSLDDVLTNPTPAPAAFDDVYEAPEASAPPAKPAAAPAPAATADKEPLKDLDEPMSGL